MTVKMHAVSLMAQLRANSNIPYGVIPTIIQSFNDMTSTITTFAQSEINCSLLAVGVDKFVADNVSADVMQKLEHCCQPLGSLSSQYKIAKYFECHPLAVMPESICIAPRLESHSGVSEIYVRHVSVWFC